MCVHTERRQQLDRETLTAVSGQISMSPCFLGVEPPGGAAVTELPFTAVLRETDVVLLRRADLSGVIYLSIYFSDDFLLICYTSAV